MAEQWRAIPGYEGRYEVSDQGRVRSTDRVVNMVDGRVRQHKGRVLKLSKHRYWNVSLYSDGRAERGQLIHWLVLRAFVGPAPEGLLARHLNDNKDDNRLSNLKYGTPSENTQDSVRNGTHPAVRKTHCSRNHEYTASNTKRDRHGWRRCRTCDQLRDRSGRVPAEQEGAETDA